jgi:hypothetical protein
MSDAPQFSCPQCLRSFGGMSGEVCPECKLEARDERRMSYTELEDEVRRLRAVADRLAKACLEAEEVLEAIALFMGDHPESVQVERALVTCNKVRLAYEYKLKGADGE